MAQTVLKERSLVTATFKDHKKAEQAYKSVINREGYSKDDVSVLMSDETRERYFESGDRVETEMGNKAAEGAGVGAATGGTLGGIAGAIAAVGTTVAIPGLGLALAGPLAGALAGAGAGGAAGTLVGGLVGAGIPEERAKRYKSDIEEGRIVLAVHPHSEEDARYFQNEWEGYGGERIHVETDTASTSATSTSATGTSTGTSAAGAAASSTGGYASYEDDFRNHFRSTYGSDADYATYEPAYRYGHEMAGNDRFRDRSYADAEADLRRRYMERHPNSTWDRVKGAVKHAFNRGRSRGSTPTRS